MKNVLPVVLMSIAVLLITSSCATVPKQPLGQGEMRLLGIDVPQGGNVSANVEYWVTLNFAAAGNPQISKACFKFLGDSLDCVDVTQRYVTYGPRPNFRVPLLIPKGQGALDCYAEYIRNGETQRTNTVSTFINSYEAWK
jgi:hypothetical protein